MDAMSSKVQERTAEWIDSRPPSTVESPSTPTTRATFRDGDTAISPRDQHGFERVPIRIHPRVFTALGADLVTDDVVAVIELVKNAYDACAHNVRLRFNAGESGSDFFEIEDDGVGMAREVIADAWCCVATPYRKASPVATRDGMRRRVVGEKGLGRLSAGRLGTRLHMLTQASGNAVGKSLSIGPNSRELKTSRRVSSDSGNSRAPRRSRDLERVSTSAGCVSPGMTAG